MMEEQDETKWKPVNLNTATEEDLARIPFLNGTQRKDLMDYLKQYGEVFSVYELLSVPGFDSITIRRINQYICFPTVSHSLPLTFGNLAKYGKNELLITAGTFFPRPNGYRPQESQDMSVAAATYPGSPYGVSFRYTYSFGGQIAIGFSGDKDPGEQFFAGAQKNGMDYYSGYVCYSGKRTLRRLIIGNFRAGWGLGLTFNNGGTLGTYPGFKQEFTGGGGIRPTQSVSESNILRGLAVNLGISRFSLSGFCSYRQRDATVIGADAFSGKALFFSSFVETGYHRSISEIKKRAQVPELIIGGNLSFRGNFFSLGITACSSSLGVSYKPQPTLYNQFSFSGKNNLVTGADFNIFYRFLRVSGEVSRSRNGCVAWITALNLNPDPRVSAVILYRNYPPGFQNMYSNCFGQNSSNSNERAWFLSLTASLPWQLNLSAFADFCSYPWAKYGINSPSSGNELGAMLNWPVHKSLNLILRFRYSSGETNISEENDIIHATGGQCIYDYRIQLNWIVSHSVVMQSRIEFKESWQYSFRAATGWLMFQDLSWKPLKFPLKLSFRYSVFDCPDYSARIWAYEQDVLYGYSMPAFYGRGIRACLFLSYTPGRHLAVSLKSGLTRYNDKNIISSGPDQIDANWRLDLAVQLRIRIN